MCVCPKCSGIRVIFFLAIFSILFGCATAEPPFDLTIPADFAQTNESLISCQDIDNQISRLDELAPPGSPRGEIVDNLRALLRARKELSKGNQDQAWAMMEKILNRDLSGVADLTFEEMVRIRAQAQAPTSRYQDFEESLIKEFSDRPGLQSFFASRGLSDQKKLASLISQWTSEYEFLPVAEAFDPKGEPKNTLGDVLGVEIDFSEFIAWPIYKIEEAVRKTCGEKFWEQRLQDRRELPVAAVNRTRFAEAVYDDCQGENVKAYKNLETLAEVANLNDGLRHAVFTKLIAMARRVGDRIKSASFYQRLVEREYNLLDLARESGRDQSTLKLNRIDDLLWAGRSLSLVGEHDSAEKFVKLAARNIKKLIQNLDSMKGQKTRLSNLLAESYHVLATRINFERQELDAAISYLLLAQNVEGINKEWKDRLSWNLGFFYYLQKDYNAAKRSLVSGLESLSMEDPAREKIYFWLARIFDEEGDTSQRDEYLVRLDSENPLSFYNVIARDIAKLGQKPQIWKSHFQQIGALRSNLVEKSHFNFSDLREDADFSKELALVEASIGSRQCLKTQQKLISRLSKTVRNTKPPLSSEYSETMDIYITRLQYAAGLYQGSMQASKIYKTSDKFWEKWPDQIFVFFPKPFSKLVNQTRHEGEVPVNAIFAVMKQESGFDPNAQSKAGAKGLMQLIDPTAQRFAKILGDDEGIATERIFDPEVNMKIGGAYLEFLFRHYQGQEASAYAAYNAGEFAVDEWLKRRGHKDILVWLESIPFAETAHYVKQVWRNRVVYDFLDEPVEAALVSMAR